MNQGGIDIADPKFKGIERVFEEHSFGSLNNIDAPIFIQAFIFFLKKYGYTGKGAIFDVGCNAGSLVKVCEFFQIRENIHCFEPHPILQQATKDVYPYIIMNPYCLSNKNGCVDFYLPTYSVVCSSMIQRPVFKLMEKDQTVLQMTVESKTIDTYCLENGIQEIDFLKIDVEGAEKMVLEGAKGFLKQKKIKCGIFEVGSTLQDANTSEDEIVKLLEGYGYVVNRNFDQSNYLFHLP